MAERADKVASIKAKGANDAGPDDASGAAGPAPPPVSGAAAGRRPPKRKGLGLFVSLVVAAVAGYFGFQEFQTRLTHVSEQDARIAGNLVTVSSRVSGWVTEVEIREAQAIGKGDVLVTIDERDSELAAERLRAQRDGIAAEQERLKAERELAAGQVSSRISTRISEVNAAKSAFDSLRPQVELAQAEYKRSQSLFRKKVLPKRELDQNRTSMQRLEGDLQTASAELESSQAKLREARAERAQLKVIDGELAMLDHKRVEIEAQLNRQLLDLADRTIRAPVNGVVDRTFVEVGEFVTPGQRLVLVHDPRKIWVEANIKETEIRRLKVGQTVEIQVDAY